MGRRPAFLVHGKECFHIAVAAERQCGYKNVCRDRFTCIRVCYGRRISRPVNLHNLARLVVQMHGGVLFYQKVIVVLVELR